MIWTSSPDATIRAAHSGDARSARVLYVAGCLAKMQRSGECSRDFGLDCWAEPVTGEHLQWAVEVLAGLDHLGPA